MIPSTQFPVLDPSTVLAVPGSKARDRELEDCRERGFRGHSRLVILYVLISEWPLYILRSRWFTDLLQARIAPGRCKSKEIVTTVRDAVRGDALC